MKITALSLLIGCGAVWGEPAPPTKQPVVVQRVPAPQQQAATTVPVILPAPSMHNKTAEAALDLSTKWLDDLTRPTRAEDGAVQYQYGRGLPVVVCAPLRICAVELEAGESVLGKPDIGDSTRWEVQTRTFGAEEQSTPVIVIKPQEDAGYKTGDTNLLVLTTKRMYYFRLVAEPKDGKYTGRIGFRYPESEERQAVQRQQIALQHRPAPKPAALAVEKLHFNYTVTGGKDYMRPTRVYDDGQQTIIEMPAAISSRELPAFSIVEDGKKITSNHKFADGRYVVERLFDEAVLTLGAGKKTKKVTIVREAKEGS